MKLHIVGASGSGFTTLGQALAIRLSFTYFDSDDYFWLPTDPPFTQRRNNSERNELILEHLSKLRNWILGGSIINWGNHLFPPFDLIVFLHLPHDIRMDRLEKREFERYDEAIYKDTERKKLYKDFIDWAKDYDYNLGIANRTLHAHETWLTNITYPVLKLTGDMTVEERTEYIIDRLYAEKLLPA